MINPESDIILIDKPAGMTSFGVVARVRRVLSSAAGKKVKVGHTGTLDPFATGLMILVVGKKCRDAQEFSKQDKWYEATIVLGKTSTTGDPEGNITDVNPRQPTAEEIERTLAGFRGKIMQTPPQFSAIKINGTRAYQLARQGKTAAIQPRAVEIFRLECIDYAYPLLKIRTYVSSGTYIRTLAEDIGAALGTGAYCQELRRTRIADYSVEAARTLAELGVES